MRIVTLPERKAEEAERRRCAVLTLREALSEYARAHGGRFLLFGSAARDTMRYHSDVDVLVDFPAEALMRRGISPRGPAGIGSLIRISPRLHGVPSGS